MAIGDAVRFRIWYVTLSGELLATESWKSWASTRMSSSRPRARRGSFMSTCAACADAAARIAATAKIGTNCFEDFMAPPDVEDRRSCPSGQTRAPALHEGDQSIFN